MRSRDSSRGSGTSHGDGGRPRITSAALHRLDMVVEELDEAIRDALDDEWDTPYARSLALDLTAILVAGVEALAAPPIIAMSPSPSRP
jgi:hypothetical protein